MSTSPLEGLGLRERKKLKTRWAIQEHALRLFIEQGYEATTVEQIAAAAEISPSTFFRYFRTKEDVVTEDEYDPMLVEAFLRQPPELPAIEAIRRGLAEAFATMDAAELRKVQTRTRLSLSVPALRARLLENLTAHGMIIEMVATRTGRSADDVALRVFAGAVVGAWMAVIPAWADGDDPGTLPGLMDEALALVAAGCPL